MIRFHRMARDEMHGAFRWYLDRSVEAAEKFLDNVELTVERIRLDPKSHPAMGKKHRYVRVAGFPYILVFRQSDEDESVVMAVAHAQRRPGYWKSHRP